MAKSKTAAASSAELLRKAVAAHRGGRALQAELLYEMVLKDSPEHAVALNYLGALRCQRGDPEAGLHLLDRALRARPDFVDAHVSRGNVLQDLGRDAEALESFERALAAEPANADALYNSGVALRKLGRHAEAIGRLQKATASAPRDANTLNDIGVSLRALGREEEAIEHFRHALRVRPDLVEALNNSGNALKALGRMDEAIAAYRRALALSPNNADLHLNLALALLAKGDWDEGWREYAQRHGAKQLAGTVPRFQQPQWKGDADLDGRTILLHAEQGFGDTLMFARYVPLVAQRGARVLLQVQTRLAPLFRGMDGVAQLVEAGDPLPAFDLHCPLPDLPLAFGTTRQTVPPAIAYRAAGAVDWNAVVSATQRPCVGIVWSGNPGYGQDRSRSIELAELEPVLTVPGIGFVSLQKDVGDQEAGMLARLGIAHTGPAQRDFGDAAALIERMDLVLSVDTSVAHLAGAIGRPLWMMLSYTSDWRWAPAGGDNPWYPRARQFRQERRADWSGPVARIVEALQRMPLAAGRIT